MKLKLLSASFLFMFFIKLSAQGNWEVLTPTPTHQSLFDTYFVTQEKGWAVGAKGTVLCTVDGGANWELQYENTEIWFNDVYFINENEGWVVGSEFILHTEDSGNTWDVKTITYYIGLNSVYFINQDIGWVVGTYNRIYKTTNGGNNWSLIESGGYGGPALEDVYFIDELHGIVVGRQEIANYNEAYIAVTEDGGETWTETTSSGFKNLTTIQFVTNDIAFAGGKDGKMLKTIDGGYSWEIIFNFTSSITYMYFFDENIAYLIDCCKVYKTNNGGYSWKTLYSGNPFLSFNAISFFDTTAYAVGFYGDIFKSSAPYEEWEDLTSLPIGHFYKINFIDSLYGWGMVYNTKTYRTDICKTRDGGIKWNFMNINDHIRDISVPSSNTIYAVGTSPYLHKSTDEGENWEHISLNQNIDNKRIKFINNQVGYLLGLTNGTMLKTIDGGTNWNEITIAGNGTFLDIQYINENELWTTDKSSSVYHTIDGGLSWTETIFDDEVTLLKFINPQKGFVYSNTDDSYGSLYKTEDGGISWEVVFNYYPANNIKFSFSNENEAWMKIGSRMYKTIDGGSNWEEIFLPTNYSCNDMFFLNKNTGWICGANSFVLKYNNNQSTIQELSENRLNVFPNPTKGNITITLSELTKEQTSLQIFDILGKLVKTIPVKKYTLDLTIDLSSLPKGMYFFEISTNDFRKTNKIIKK